MSRRVDVRQLEKLRCNVIFFVNIGEIVPLNQAGDHPINFTDAASEIVGDILLRKGCFTPAEQLENIETLIKRGRRLGGRGLIVGLLGDFQICVQAAILRKPPSIEAAPVYM